MRKFRGRPRAQCARYDDSDGASHGDRGFEGWGLEEEVELIEEETYP